MSSSLDNPIANKILSNNLPAFPSNKSLSLSFLSVDDSAIKSNKGLLV